MNKTMKKILIAIAVILVVGFLVFRGTTNTSTTKTFAGIDDSSVYIASTTSSVASGLNLKYKGATVAASSTPIGGVLGSFVITGTSASVIEIKDATSTTDLSSTTLAIFAASAPAGSYIFDVAFSRGLMVNYLGTYTGNATITYK